MKHPLAYVAKVFPRTSETFVINELRALEELGENPVVFSLHHNPAAVSHAILGELRAPVEYVEDVEVDDRDVRRAAERLARELAIPEQERGRVLPRKYVRLAVALAGLAERHGVRHLHAHFASRSGHVAALAATLMGTGYSITAHAKDIYHRDVDRDLLAWKIRHARFVVTVTDFNHRHLLELLGRDGERDGGRDGGRDGERDGGRDGGHGGERDRERSGSVVRLYNGVDLDRFTVPPLEAGTSGANVQAASEAPLEKSPRIVSIGRLVEKKGFGVLLDACATLKSRGVVFDCEIIGGGDLEPALRQRIGELDLGGNVTLAGSLTTEAVAERLRDATVVALPCIVGGDGNVDALPTALLEGMACGLPLVSTRLSGIPEIVVDGENGLLVEPGDAGALAAALQAILADPARAAAMGRAGRARAEQLFDLRRNVAELAGMFHRCMAQEKATA